MHFFVDVDSGIAISGWLVPDNPRDVPRFIVRVVGRPDVEISANVLRADLRDIGLHATGLAGFRIDEEQIPDLAAIIDLTLFEAETGLPIYRRYAPGQFVEKKFLFVDIGILPQIKLLRQVMHFFALSYPLVDRWPMETISMLMNNKEASSILLAGHPNWIRHGSAARERQFVNAALLRDPFEDLAERLLFISHLAKQPLRSRMNSSLEKYAELSGIVQDMDFTSSKSVLTGFRRMSPDNRKMFRSPLTLTFGSTPEAELQRRNVSVALDNLAQFDVVGIRPRFAEFCSMVDENLSVPAMRGCELDTLPGTWELASVLSDVGLVADLLDEDIALYSFASEAVEAGLQVASDQQAATSGSK